jgi:hypothetical protein
MDERGGMDGGMDAGVGIGADLNVSTGNRVSMNLDVDMRVM